MAGSPPHGYAKDPAAWLSDRPVALPVTGRSMEPFLKTGDRVEAVRTSPAELRRGQIIVLRRGEEVVIHRFLAGESERLLEKGDAQARGNWWSWPDAIGVAVAVIRDGRRLDLREGPWPATLGREGARHLRIHRVQVLSEKLPTARLRRMVARLARLL
jgi:hypothetical protein